MYSFTETHEGAFMVLSWCATGPSARVLLDRCPKCSLVPPVTCFTVEHTGAPPQLSVGVSQGAQRERESLMWRASRAVVIWEWVFSHSVKELKRILSYSHRSTSKTCDEGPRFVNGPGNVGSLHFFQHIFEHQTWNK